MNSELEERLKDPDEMPEFGDRDPQIHYVARPGSYAVIHDHDGRVAILQTPRGCYLPGGGSDVGETPEQTLIREVREECGFTVGQLTAVGRAVEYVHTTGHEHGIRKECAFYVAAVEDATGSATEADHNLIWLSPEEAVEKLAHASQAWVVGRCAMLSTRIGT